MAFNNDTTGKTVKYNSGSKEEYVLASDGSEDAKGARLLGFVDENKNGKTALFSNLAGLKNETWSPLAESLYEAGIYFQKGTSAITGTSYASSPVQYYCQKNYVLIISDGDPTKDTEKLDDVAKYLYGLNLNNDPKTSPQNIKTIRLDSASRINSLRIRQRQGAGNIFMYGAPRASTSPFRHSSQRS